MAHSHYLMYFSRAIIKIVYEVFIGNIWCGMKGMYVQCYTNHRYSNGYRCSYTTPFAGELEECRVFLIFSSVLRDSDIEFNR